MKSLKKCAALLTSAAMVTTMASCGNTKYGLVIDGYEVRAGIFIFYTISSYYEAAQIISEDGTDVTNIDNVKNAYIDNLPAADWIQNKATEYCSNYVAVQKKFDEIGAEITSDEQAEIDETIAYYLESNEAFYKKNGIGEESLTDILTFEYKRDHVFDYYYGVESENGMSDAELQDYFNENYARVKYVTIDLKDADGNLLKGEDKTKLINMANDYADQVNECDSEMDKLFEMNEVKADYDEYVAEQTAVSNAESGITTTMTAAVTTSENESTVTTTTNPYENESLIQLVTEPAATTTDPAAVVVTGTTVTEAEINYVPSKVANEFIFNEAEIGVASVVEDAEAVYVIFRADLRERLTEDDLWNENNIQTLQSTLYDEDFSDFIDELISTYEIKKNEASYKRYAPFELDLSQESASN